MNNLCALFVVLCACASSHDETPPTLDAAPPRVIDPMGRFELHSTWDIGEPPEITGDVLHELVAATDGADDPSRYLIDRVVAGLPDGGPKTLALVVSPWLAAYVNGKLDDIAPQFVQGSRAIVDRLARAAQHFETSEDVTIDERGVTRRTIVGLRIGAIAVPFERIAPVSTLARIHDGELAIAAHVMRVPYGSMLRAALDGAIVPGIVPQAHDLASALDRLVDCPRLGTMIAGWLEVGAPALYTAACRTALTALASEIDARLVALDAEPVVFELAGSARARDTDNDGRMDTIDKGTWTFTGGTASFMGRIP